MSDSVVLFENAIFSGCTSLSDVRLSNNMTTITDTMFQYTAITTIDIPSSVTKIDRVAFDLCESLTSIVIPSSVTTFGETVFNRCANLKEITFEGNAPEIIPAGIASHWANTSDQPKLLNIGYDHHQMFPNLYLPDDFIIKYYSDNSGFTEEWFNSVLRNYNSSKSVDLHIGDIEEGLVSYYDFSSLSATQGSGNNILLYNDAEIYNDLERGSVLRIVTDSTQAGIYGNISQAPGGHALLNGALDDISNNGNNDFSLSLWLKLENTQVHPGGSIINLGDNNSVYERPIIGYVNQLNGQDNSNTEAPLYLITPGNEDWNILANLSDILNVWQHYVITVTDNTLRLYLNGVEIESYLGGNLWDSVNTVGEKLYFGAEIWTGSGGDRGSTRITARFDDLKVYNRRLTSNEIIQLANL